MLVYNECLKILKNTSRIIRENDLDIIIKPIPDDDRSGVPDPRMIESVLKSRNHMSPLDTSHITEKEIYTLRSQMGCENIDLSCAVMKQSLELTTSAGDVPVCIYTPDSTQGNLALVVYIHGGAFIGGTTGVVENACKLTAERSEAVVISVSYALAPENQFPCGLEQCNQVVQWAFEHATSLGCDPKKLVVMGDSAGANLATACCMLDLDHRIMLQVLLYPVTQLVKDVEKWDYSRYTICEHEEILKNIVYDIGTAKEICRSLYVSHPEELMNPLISPLQARSLKEMPETLIITAEFDYLRLEAEEYARRLQEDGVKTMILRYNGINHSFFEHTGEFPQAEDCTNEIANVIQSLH